MNLADLLDLDKVELQQRLSLLSLSSLGSRIPVFLDDNMYNLSDLDEERRYDFELIRKDSSQVFKNYTKDKILKEIIKYKDNNRIRYLRAKVSEKSYNLDDGFKEGAD